MTIKESNRFKNCTAVPNTLYVLFNDNKVEYALEVGDYYYKKDDIINKNCTELEGIVKHFEFSNIPYVVWNEEEFQNILLKAYSDIAKEVSNNLDFKSPKLGVEKCLGFLTSYGSKEITNPWCDSSLFSNLSCLKSGLTCYELFIKRIYPDNFNEYLEPFKPLMEILGRDSVILDTYEEIGFVNNDSGEFESFRLDFDLVTHRLVIQMPDFDSLSKYIYVNDVSKVPLGLVAPKMLCQEIYKPSKLSFDDNKAMEDLKKYLKYVAKISKFVEPILDSKLKYLQFLDLDKKIDNVDCFEMEYVKLARKLLAEGNTENNGLLINSLNIILNSAVITIKTNEKLDNEDVQYLLELLEIFL